MIVYFRFLAELCYCAADSGDSQLPTVSDLSKSSCQYTAKCTLMDAAETIVFLCTIIIL